MLSRKWLLATRSIFSYGVWKLTRVGRRRSSGSSFAWCGKLFANIWKRSHDCFNRCFRIRIVAGQKLSHLSVSVCVLLISWNKSMKVDFLFLYKVSSHSTSSNINAEFPKSLDEGELSQHVFFFTFSDFLSWLLPCWISIIYISPARWESTILKRYGRTRLEFQKTTFH